MGHEILGDTNYSGDVITILRAVKIKAPARKKVVIEVRGGVAYVTYCPKGVEVKIIDRDNH